MIHTLITIAVCLFAGFIFLLIASCLSFKKGEAIKKLIPTILAWSGTKPIWLTATDLHQTLRQNGVRITKPHLYSLMAQFEREGLVVSKETPDKGSSLSFRLSVLGGK